MKEGVRQGRGRRNKTKGKETEKEVNGKEEGKDKKRTRSERNILIV